MKLCKSCQEYDTQSITQIANKCTISDETHFWHLCTALYFLIAHNKLECLVKRSVSNSGNVLFSENTHNMSEV